MATNPFNNVVLNANEDFYDELISNVVHGETKKVMDKVTDSLGLEEGNYLDDAIESALTTFQQGMMQAVILVISEYFIAKSALILTGLFVYIRGMSFVSNIKKSTKDIFFKAGSRGTAVGKALKSIRHAAIGKSDETLAIAKMTNDTSNNIISNVSQERQNQILLRTQKAQRVDATRANIYSIKNKSREKNMTLFVWKTTNGMWEKTQKDENLYKQCVGDLAVPFNVDFVKKLNSLADVVKTAKGEIISRAKAQIDMITAIGANVKG